MDGYLRAFDVETGAELWRDRLPAARHREPDDLHASADGSTS